MEGIVLFFAILSTIFFINYKYSKAIRIFAFNEEETPKDAVLSFGNMILVAILWTIYFSCF
jgi:hypothetical protein